MRQIEKLTALILFIVFFYSLISLTLNFLDTKFDYLVPSYVLITTMTVTSLFFGSFSPFWNVGKHLGTQNVKIIVNYGTKQKVKFLNLFLGYVGIMLIFKAKIIFDGIWWLGMSLVAICTTYVFIILFLRPKLKENAH